MNLCRAMQKARYLSKNNNNNNFNNKFQSTLQRQTKQKQLHQGISVQKLYIFNAKCTYKIATNS